MFLPEPIMIMLACRSHNEFCQTPVFYIVVEWIMCITDGKIFNQVFFFRPQLGMPSGAYRGTLTVLSDNISSKLALGGAVVEKVLFGLV